MLKRLAADALGLSDIGSIIDPKDFDKVSSDDYIFYASFRWYISSQFKKTTSPL